MPEPNNAAVTFRWPRSKGLAAGITATAALGLALLPIDGPAWLLLAAVFGGGAAWLGWSCGKGTAVTDTATPVSGAAIPPQMAARMAELEAKTAALEAAERRHRELIDLSTDYAWEQDEHGRFTYFSEGAARCGLVPARALGKTRFELASEFIGGTAEEHRRVLDAHLPFRDVRYVHLRAGGQKLYFSSSGNPLFGESGEFLGYRGVGKNISHEFVAEMAARESEERFRSLLETAADWYWAQGPDLRFSEIVAAGGGRAFDGQDYLGKFRWEMPWVGVTAADWVRHQAVLAKREPFHDLILARQQTNGVRYISISGVPIFGSDGEFQGYHGTARDVTAIVRLSEALGIAEDRYRVVAQATVSAIWDHDEASGITRWTRGIDEIFGYQVAGQDLRTEWWLERVHPDDREAVMANYAAVAAAGGREMNAEYRFARASGSYAWVVDRGVILHDDTGKIYRRIGGVIDITAQREAEFALRESEARFRALAEAAPVMVWLTDSEGHFSYFNGQLAEFAGGMGAAPKLASWSQVVLPADRAAWETGLAEAHAQGRAFRLECRARRGDGSVRWLLLSGTPRRADDGRDLGFIGSGVDITERRHAESLLSLQSRTFERVATGSDLDFTLFSLVQALESEMELGRCGLFRVEEGGARLRLGPCPSLPVEYQRACDGMAVREGEGSSGTAAFRREPVVVSDIALDVLWEEQRAAALKCGLQACTAVPVLGRRGEVLGTLAVYYPEPMRPPTWDVQLLSVGSALAALTLERAQDEAAVKAAQTSLEERVKERTAQLEAANKELEAFSYSVSHDLRAPLRTIDGFTQIVSQRYRERLDAEAQAYFDRVRAGCRRMSELIDDLLRLSMVTRGGVTRQEVDLSEIGRQVIDALQQNQMQRRAMVSIAAGLHVRGDPKLLRVLLENLLGNAWKFTAKKPLAEVAFTAEVQGGTVVYCVGDNGAGFDMRYADRLFAPFERLHHRDQFEGTGIGLATAQRVVRVHGGKIWAQSAPEQGTKMFFTLG